MIAAAVLVAPARGRATELTTGAQMGVSRASIVGPSHDAWTVWARQADGTVVYNREQNGFHAWYDPNPHPIPQVVVNPNGVTATGWNRIGTVYERGYYVGSDSPPWIYEYRLVNGVNGGQIYAYPPPPGLTLTGHIAASHRKNADGNSTVLVYATFTNGTLWALKIDGWGIAPAAWEQLAAGISTSAPVAASESPDETVSRVFATVASNSTVVTKYFDGAFSALSNIGKPAGGQINVCATAAAAEGWVGASLYFTYVFCTAFPGSAANREDLHYAFATKVRPGASDFTWGRGDLGAGESALNIGYAIAARARNEPGRNPIDVFLLNTATTNTKIFHFEHEADQGGLGGVQTLGADAETSRRFGGLAAAPQPAHYSDVFFVGRTGTADRLYRRLGDENESAALPQNWTYYQSASPTADIALTGANSEPCTALFQGRAINVSILESANPTVQARWSDDDGDTWGAPTTLSNAGYSYVRDPTVDFNNQGDAYIGLFGITHQLPFCDSTQTTIASGIYYVKRLGSTGAYQNPVTIVSSVSAVPQVARWDHPWVSINRADNRVHFVWTDRGADRTQGIIGYAQSTNDFFFQTSLRDFSQVGHPLVDNAQFPTVVTVGAGGATYVAWSRGICRINAAFTGCEAVGAVPADRQAQEPPGGVLTFAGTGSFLLAGTHSFVASPSDSNKVYMVYQRVEADGDELDSFLSVITYNPATLTFDFSLPTRLAAELALDEDTNQFSPEVAVSRDDVVGDTIFATWYDTRASGGAACGQTNRCYVPRHATSRDQGWSFESSQPVCRPVDDYLQGALCEGTDPDLLPSFCAAGGNGRFVGEYHFTTGDVLHSYHTEVIAPSGSPATTGRLLNGSASRGNWSW